MKTSSIKNSLKTVVPCVTYGTFCGALTGAVVFCFKLAAKYLEEISRFVYSLPSKNSLFILAIFAGLVILALSEFLLHKKLPEVRGGGIPRTEGILRGMLSFKGLRTLVGTAFGSFVSFFAGLPLGSEGPAVLIGTSVGGLCIGKRSSHSAWQRYVMSGGAGAGFAVATGAPISGMLFVVEEVHKKFAPTLILIVSVSVIFVVGKSVRDIMWPHATVIVSINRDNKDFSDTDLDGEKQLRVGDTLVIRARTYDVEELKEYLYSLVGREYHISVS